MNCAKMMEVLASIISGIVVLTTAILNFRSILECYAWIYKILSRIRITREKELKMTLYFYQIYGGSNKNQEVVLDRGSGSFGSIAVNDWPLYDGHGPDKKVVARARGMQLQSSNQGKNSGGAEDVNIPSSAYMSLVFEDDRYKGNTLEVMGISTWAIIGGTGGVHSGARHYPVGGRRPPIQPFMIL